MPYGLTTASEDTKATGLHNRFYVTRFHLQNVLSSNCDLIRPELHLSKSKELL